MPAGWQSPPYFKEGWREAPGWQSPLYFKEGWREAPGWFAAARRPPPLLRSDPSTTPPASRAPLYHPARFAGTPPQERRGQEQDV